MKTEVRWVVWATWAIAIVLASTAAVAEERPNIVVIMADDLGYTDVGCYGCKDIPTPNINQLAAEGVRFTSAYVTGCMCPCFSPPGVTATTALSNWHFSKISPRRLGRSLSLPALRSDR